MAPRAYSIVVLGSGGVGKSCLTAQFVNNIWIENYDPTIEDSYRKQLDVDGRQVVLEILDTAGSEQFTALREIFIRAGHGFLLVFSITSPDSFDEVNSLREQILRIKLGQTSTPTPTSPTSPSSSSQPTISSSSSSSPVPLVLVGNKCDLRVARKVSRSLAFNVSRQWGCVPYYETSARKRDNVDDVFRDVCRQIIRQELAERGDDGDYDSDDDDDGDDRRGGRKGKESERLTAMGRRFAEGGARRRRRRREKGRKSSSKWKTKSARSTCTIL